MFGASAQPIEVATYTAVDTSTTVLRP